MAPRRRRRSRRETPRQPARRSAPASLRECSDSAAITAAISRAAWSFSIPASSSFRSGVLLQARGGTDRRPCPGDRRGDSGFRPPLPHARPARRAPVPDGDGTRDRGRSHPDDPRRGDADRDWPRRSARPVPVNMTAPSPPYAGISACLRTWRMRSSSFRACPASPPRRGKNATTAADAADRSEGSRLRRAVRAPPAGTAQVTPRRSVPGQRRIDLVDPVQDAALQVLHAREACSWQQRHRLGAAAAHLAVDDHLAVAVELGRTRAATRRAESA